MYALVIFLGSFLLFGIQPMLGRLLLPGFGGSAAVWSVCLAAYQVLLLAGYVYAHGVSRMRRGRQWGIHALALVVAGAWSLGVAAMWPQVYDQIGNTSLPGLEVLMYVAAFIGLPYVLLASGSSLLQAWLVQRKGRRVYGLYAVSNLGSFLGLFFYPLVVEPFVPLAWQWWGFATAFCCYGLLVIAAGRMLLREGADDTADAAPAREEMAVALPRPLTRAWLWVALPGMTSFLLVAVTNHLTLDVTPIPLMWAMLLGLFLLSYVIGFSRLGEKGLAAWMFLCVVSLLGLGYLLVMKGTNNVRFVESLRWGGLAFGLVCVFLHSWLYTIRPVAKESLTRFYLGIAVGGAIGGVFGSLVCPLIFNTILEWPLGIVAIAAGLGWFIFAWRRRDLVWFNRCALVALAAVPVLVVWSFKRNPVLEGDVLTEFRNFYGTLTLTRRDVTRPGERHQDAFNLTHGKTLHGMQSKKYWDDDPVIPERAMEDKAMRSSWDRFPMLTVIKHPLAHDVQATTYYGPAGGGAAVVTRHASKGTNETLRVGLVGLGAGTMAAWANEGDVFRFYEINAAVPDIALDDRHFNFLSSSKADVEIVIGDARKILEAEDKAGFPGWDVLVIDAYSGDSIPFHLATKEAFELYRRRLAPGGILAVHLSNWHIDLMPLVKAVAVETGMTVHGVMSGAQGEVSAASWAFFAEEDFKLIAPLGIEVDWAQVKAMPRVPTDTHGSLIPLVRLRGMNTDEILKKPDRRGTLDKLLGKNPAKVE